MTVRVGMVGAGRMAAVHASAFRSVAGADLVAVHDVDPERAAALARTSGAAAVPTIDDLVEECDAVLVCTWTSEHEAAVARAVTAGRAVFCEKPLAPSLARARSLTEVVRTAGVVNQVGLPLRWSPTFAVLRHLLADPGNGQILTATLHSEAPGRDGFAASWRGDVTKSGGGMLVEVGFHDIDLLEWLIAPADSVSAFVRPGAREGIEDGAAVTLRFGGGAVGALVTVWHDIPRRPQTRALSIVCENARFLVDAGTTWSLQVTGPGRRDLTLDAGELERRAVGLGLPIDAHGAFVRAVEDRVDATPSLADGLRVHQVIDAAYRSASRDGATVAVAG